MEPFDGGEELPNYWKNWTKEAAAAQSAGVHLRNRKGMTVEGLEKIEPRIVHLEESKVKELTFIDACLNTIKIIGRVIGIIVGITIFLSIFYLYATAPASAK